MKKVVIVGAGPAGIFAANELAGKCDVTVIDKGKDIETRTRDNVLEGVGGAGLFSDGKMIYHTRVGTFLPLIVGVEKVSELNDYVESIFKNYGAYVKVLNEKNERKLEKFRRKSLQTGLNFVVTRTAHIGTDKLVDLIRSVRDDLTNKGIEFCTDEEVLEVNKKNVKTDHKNHKYDYLVLAPGRDGSEWLEKIVRKDFKFEFGQDYVYNPVDMGVRVEVKREITDTVTDLTRDMKFYINAGLANRQVRTFCTCPGGKVAIEKHRGYLTVNGHSEAGDPYENTNFAFLVTIPFSKPQANGNDFAKLEAKKVYNISGGKVLVQRFGDMLRGRRSKEECVNDWLTQPSLKEAVPGSIPLHMPYEYMDTMIDGLQKLGQVLPGIDSEHTLLYSPEIKLHSLRLLTDDHLQTHIPNIYAAGDGPGFTRGIVAAAATGVLAARGILRK
jgi:uncharacterized FAD-dependent dehydrogenase